MATFIKAGFWEQLCKPCRGYKGWLNLDELIKSLAPPAPEPAYRVYTALLTQSGGDSDAGLIDNGIVVGVTYRITPYGNEIGVDFTNIGAPNNNAGTYFVATGITPNSWGINTNDSWVLQYNSGAPVVTVLENTIGNIWFTYDSTGYYYINSSDLFITDKTFTPINTNDTASGTIIFGYQGVNTIDIFCSGGNDVLYKTPIEIRVYN
jgi:hypothetical protein